MISNLNIGKLPFQMMKGTFKFLQQTLIMSQGNQNFKWFPTVFRSNYRLQNVY